MPERDDLFEDFRYVTRPEWGDSEKNLRRAYEVVVMDHAIDRVFDAIGLGRAYRDATNHATFAVETHALHERRVRAGAELAVATWLVAVDDKRLHLAQELRVPGEPARLSLLEQISIHVDLGARRAVPFPPALGERLRAATTRDRTLPPGLGRAVWSSPG